MSRCYDDASVNLIILRGYGKLLGLPHVAHGGRTVALERVGDCEITMFEALGSGSPEAPLFWIELFDLRVHSSLDSGGCHNIGEAVAVFKDFALQASRLTEVLPCMADETVD